MYEYYSKGYYWIEILDPTLHELRLEFDKFLLVASISLNESYIGFIKVRHISNDDSNTGQWFSNYVKITASFSNELTISLQPVHFRREILDWNKGQIIFDNRKEM